MKIVEKKASDNQYLHKDFHGAMSYAISYIDAHYGDDGIKEYLKQVAKNAYSPLIEAVRQEDLSAIEKHLRKIFELEQGEFSIKKEDDKLTMTVKKCPAIHHIKEINQFHTHKFCQTTVVVNQTICEEAGLKFSCTYNVENGTCEQVFWR